MRRPLPFASLAPTIALVSCVPAQRAPSPAPPPPAPPPRIAAALAAAPPQQDWRDVPLTPGTWTWRGMPGSASLAAYGVTAQPPIITIRCDVSAHAVVLTLGGVATRGGAVATTMTITTSYAPFTLVAGLAGDGLVAQLGARDSRLDQIAFSRGRFLVDAAGTPRLILPAWPEVARVIEDCRS